MLPFLLKSSPSHHSELLLRLRRSLLLPLFSSKSLFSAAAAPSFLPLPPDSSPTLDPLPSSEIAASFKEWFQTSKYGHSTSLSLLDQIYSALSSAPDGPFLDAALSALPLPRLSESLVLQTLNHHPHPSATAKPSNLLLLRLKFFDWSGRQPGYAHTRAAYHAVFRLLSRARLVSVVLDWLHLFQSSKPLHNPPFLGKTPSGSGYPRFNDTLIIGYAVAGRPELALQLFAKMRFRGLDLDYFSYHVLLNSLVEASIFDFADSLFDQMAARGLATSVTDCIRIKCLCRQNKLDEAISYLQELAGSDGRAVAKQTVATLVGALCNKGRFDEAGLLIDEFGTEEAYGVLVTHLVRAKKLDFAIEFLKSKKVLEKYNVETLHYNRLLKGLLRELRLEQAYDVLVEMMQEGIPPNWITMNVALCFFCKAGMVDVAVQLYQSRMELGISPTSWVYNHMISALCYEGSVNEVCEVLEESMQNGYFPRKGTFNILANLLCREGKLDKLRKLLDGALQRRMSPIMEVWARYISALCKAGQVEEACSVPQMVKGENTLLSRYKYTYTSLIEAFVALKKVDVLPRLLIEMQEQGHSPSPRLYRAVVCCLCEAERFDMVLHLLNRQLDLKKPDLRTCYNYIIDGTAKSKIPELARVVYSRMENAGIEPNMDTDILLLQSYMKSRRISDAIHFFYYLQDKRQPSTKLYNIFISGLCEARKVEEAMVFWKKMREKGLLPSLQCYEELVRALCTSRDYGRVVEVLDDFKKTGRQVSSFICNVLLLHTMKGQDLARAWVKSRKGKEDATSDKIDVETPGAGRMLLGNIIAVFSGGLQMEEKNLQHLNELIDRYNLDEFVERYFLVDVYTYNMLLRLLSRLGRMDHVCDLFSRMNKKGYEPNRWTYDIIVHGFCKQRERKEAERWMEIMYKNGYNPTKYTSEIFHNTV